MLVEFMVEGVDGAWFSGSPNHSVVLPDSTLNSSSGLAQDMPGGPTDHVVPFADNHQVPAGVSPNMGSLAGPCTPLITSDVPAVQPKRIMNGCPRVTDMFAFEVNSYQFAADIPVIVPDAAGVPLGTPSAGTDG